MGSLLSTVFFPLCSPFIPIPLFYPCNSTTNQSFDWCCGCTRQHEGGVAYLWCPFFSPLHSSLSAQSCSPPLSTLHSSLLLSPLCLFVCVHGCLPWFMLVWAAYPHLYLFTVLGACIPSSVLVGSSIPHSWCFGLFCPLPCSSRLAYLRLRLCKLSALVRAHSRYFRLVCPCPSSSMCMSFPLAGPLIHVC